MSTTTEEKRTTRQIIWGALVDLRAQQQIATRQVLAEVTGLFQSTPAIADGRTFRRRPAHHARSGFNPRPPSLTGEPQQEQHDQTLAPVSIHARHR